MNLWYFWGNGKKKKIISNKINYFKKCFICYDCLQDSVWSGSSINPRNIVQWESTILELFHKTLDEKLGMHFSSTYTSYRKDIIYVRVWLSADPTVEICKTIITSSIYIVVHSNPFFYFFIFIFYSPLYLPPPSQPTASTLLSAWLMKSGRVDETQMLKI